MQIYCKKCLELKCIAKYYPTEWYCNSNKGGIIQDFLTEHCSRCWNDKGKLKDVFGGTDMFGFRTELSDDDFISDYNTKPYKLKKL